MRIAHFLLASAIAALGATTALAATQTVQLPKGTTVQKLGPGHFRFSLPDGRKVEVRNFNARTGIIGDSGVYDATGKRLAGGGRGQLRGAAPLSRAQAAKMPKSDYVQIDDEVTWLPATVQFQSAPAQLSPQPDPPGRVLPGKAAPGGRGIGDPDPPPAQRRFVDPDPPP